MKEELEKWFKERPLWLQEAVRLLITKGDIGDQDYEDLYKICLDEAKQQSNQASSDIPIDHLLGNRESNKEIRIKSIGDIKGINKLHPKKPLEFGQKNLTIIYGSNRAGKSGYARILKHICGAKSRAPLLPNIFQTNHTEQKCNIEYLKGDDSESVKIRWSPSNGIINDLNCVNIFDSECGKVYVADENEPAFEPRILSFFSKLVKICEKLSSKITTEIGNHPSKIPNCPPEYSATQGGKWHEKLSKHTTQEELSRYCQWIPENEKDLLELEKRLAQPDPAKKAEELRKQNKYIEDLINQSGNLVNSFSKEKHEKINDLKKKYITAKETAGAATKQLSEISNLEGVGSDVWKQLWKYAKEYSEKEAYKGQHFPVVSNGAHCVLCQQKLDVESQERLSSFKDFLEEETQKAETEAKTLLDQSIQNLPQIPNTKDLKTKIDASGLQLEWEELKNLYIELNNRREKFASLNNQDLFSALPSVENWKREAKETLEKNERNAKQYDEDSKGENKDDLLFRKKELQCKKWLDQNKNAIEEEIKRLKHIAFLGSAKKLTDTTAISKKKGQLSEKLITQGFIERFNIELKKLKAEEIEVEIIKSKVQKGKSFHKIRLKKSHLNSVKTENVLSEGENRIVALSLFLADVTGRDDFNPFIFDDPISSLDQDFEEAVAKRLIELSEKQQVIIFTHRLSLLGLIEEYCGKKNIEKNIVYIEKEPWGTGEPGSIPLFAKNPETSLNSLIEKLPQVKKTFKEQRLSAYTEKAKPLCSDFRIVIEKTVENILLKDVIKRHRRAIHIRNILDLHKINQNDCNFLDNLMTKYSKLVHSSSNETSNEIPRPDELCEDFNKLKEWMQSFKKRCV